jgi:trehalose 6-phosphate phosphatase
VPAGLVETLRRLAAALGGAVAIVSGRPVAHLRKFFPRLDPGVVLVAEHGAIASVPLSGSSARNDRAVPRALAPSLRRFAAEHPGALLEIKPHGVALHVRNAPKAAPAARRLVRQMAAEQAGKVRLIEGRAVFEFVPAGISKGHAIEALMRRRPFQGRACVVAGDDVTDEDGFVVANRLGGISLRVNGRPMGNTPSAARFTIATPAALREWLRASADRLIAESAKASNARKRP